MEKTYQDERNELLDFLLHKAVYPKLKLSPLDKRPFKLELYVTGKCNKKCEYCYLSKYENELYPIEIDNIKEILNNTKLLLDHLIDQKVTVTFLDLFSGEIVGTKLYFDLLDILLEKVEALGVKQIMVPSNCSFLNGDQECIDKVQQYIDLFTEKGITFSISCSEEGYVLDEINRPLKSGKDQNKQKNDYYDKLAKFANHNNFGFHPMVNAHSIDKWCENLDWWIKWSKENFNRSIFEQGLFLEVRNDEWTDEAITGYIKFLKHFIEESYKSLNDKVSVEGFINYLICPWEKTIETKDHNQIEHKFLNSYIPYKIHHDYLISCSYTQALCVRLGDLAICPCHRTSYEHLIIGKYKVENNKIIGVIAQNIETFLNGYIIDSRGNIKCDVCPINLYCIKGCHGAQYEVFKDMNYPIESVCNLSKVKLMYILINLVYWGNQLNINLTREASNELNNHIKVLAQLQAEDEEFYNKWKNVIYQQMLEL